MNLPIIDSRPGHDHKQAGSVGLHLAHHSAFSWLHRAFLQAHLFRIGPIPSFGLCRGSCAQGLQPFARFCGISRPAIGLCRGYRLEVCQFCCCILDVVAQRTPAAFRMLDCELTPSSRFAVFGQYSVFPTYRGFALSY